MGYRCGDHFGIIGLFCGLLMEKIALSAPGCQLRVAPHVELRIKLFNGCTLGRVDYPPGPEKHGIPHWKVLLWVAAIMPASNDLRDAKESRRRKRRNSQLLLLLLGVLLFAAAASGLNYALRP